MTVPTIAEMFSSVQLGMDMQIHRYINDKRTIVDKKTVSHELHLRYGTQANSKVFLRARYE